MIYLAVSLLLGFLTVYVGTPYAKRYLLASGIFAVDQQKDNQPKLPTSGGTAVLFGFLVSVTSYLGLASFFRTTELAVVEVLAALSSVTIITLIGLVDDIHIKIDRIIEDELELENEDYTLEIHEVLESETNTNTFIDRVKGSNNSSDDMMRVGLGQIPKMLFVLPAAFPLIAVGAGSWEMALPLIGLVDWGIFYPLVLLPLGLLFVSNVVNMLAGANGLSASMSMVAATALGIFGYVNGHIEAAVIGFSLAVALLAFLRYNMYPASILPGDSLTYLCGAALFSTIVIGDMEKFGVFIFLPWIIEFGLKAQSGFKAHSWGKLKEDGSLESQHDKVYSLTHVLMKRNYTENQITLILTGVQILISVTGLILFTAGLL
jgi:UDP-N-acetylglucosamine--dolichyl-phosphate N-acetylglucosaminephosphotransferase